MATETMATETTTETIADRTFILSLRVGSIRGRNPKVKRDVVERMARGLTVEEPETVEDMALDAADELRVTKALLRVEEVDALVKALVECRGLVRRGAIMLSPPKRKEETTPGTPTRRVAAGRILKAGMYVYSSARVEWVEARIDESQKAVAELLDRLEARYDDILREEEIRLKPLGLWDPRDYPTIGAIRACATIEYSWFKFSVPEAMELVSRTVWEREKAKARELWSDLTERVRLSYASTLEMFVEKLRAALVPGEDGKKKVLRQATIDNMTDFLNGFALDDVTDYADLRALVEKAKAAMRGIDAEVLRSEDKAADRVALEMARIGEKLSEMVIVQGRRLRLED